VLLHGKPKEGGGELLIVGGDDLIRSKALLSQDLVNPASSFRSPSSSDHLRRQRLGCGPIGRVGEHLLHRSTNSGGLGVSRAEIQGISGASETSTYLRLVLAGTGRH